MLTIDILPMLRDNYSYLIRDEATSKTAVIDPSEAAPAIAALEQRGWSLDYIVNTHHHWDHVGGNLALKERFGCRIVGPEYDRHRLKGLDQGLRDGDLWQLGASNAQILHIPGHTTGHIALWFAGDHALFCGDTLFSLGCGRLFEGTPSEMWTSLSRLASLPDETQVYPGHEYTEANAHFALHVDPGNEALRRRQDEVRALRKLGRPSIPARLGDEKRANPFLRAQSEILARALGLEGADPVAVFAALRCMKDKW